MIELLGYTFMQRALIMSTVIGAICALIGVYVVLRSMSFIGAGISHASFGGVALGFLLGINPFFTAVLFCLAMAWAIGFVSEKKRLREDTAVGIFFAATMALGILFISLLKGYNTDLFGYIFGNILAVTRFDIFSGLALALIVVGTIVFLFREFLFITFDAEMAEITGLPVRMLNFIMLTLIALTVVISIKAVGIVLVSALIVAPAAAALQLTTSFKKVIWIAVALGIGASWIGLVLSAILNIASGATIVLIATLVFFLAYFFSPQRRSLRIKLRALKNGQPNRCE